MAWTQADLDAINTAIATGAKRVRFQTHEVEYQEMSDLLRARDIIRAEIDSAPGNGGAILSEYHGGY